MLSKKMTTLFIITLCIPTITRPMLNSLFGAKEEKQALITIGFDKETSQTVNKLSGNISELNGNIAALRVEIPAVAAFLVENCEKYTVTCVAASGLILSTTGCAFSGCTPATIGCSAFNAALLLHPKETRSCINETLSLARAIIRKKAAAVPSAPAMSRAAEEKKGD
ncbi:MAG: hypothetical protein NTX86_03530 [Candidatus Dependentiae bacterium]|nr:hypothetical protein [Candidatus Dependentiae bacterium]